MQNTIWCFEANTTELWRQKTKTRITDTWIQPAMNYRAKKMDENGINAKSNVHTLSDTVRNWKCAMGKATERPTDLFRFVVWYHKESHKAWDKDFAKCKNEQQCSMLLQQKFVGRNKPIAKLNIEYFSSATCTQRKKLALPSNVYHCIIR